MTMKGVLVMQVSIVRIEGQWTFYAVRDSRDCEFVADLYVDESSTETVQAEWAL